MSSTYKTIQGDTWDLISYRVYGDESHMSTLIEANEKYLDIAVFPQGTILTCPDIEPTGVTFLPPWRR